MNLYSFLLLLLIKDCTGSFMPPKNINFDIQYFNTSNCSDNPYHDTSFVSYCENNDKINGYYKCCYDILNKLTVEDISFNVCYEDNFNGTISYIKYDCHVGNINDVTSLEIFALIGFICLAILCFALVFSCCRLMCRNNSRNEYIKINT